MIRSLIVILAVVIGLAGCGHRAKIISDVHSVVVQQHSAEQVRNAIMQAGKARQWVMKDAGPGVINAHISVREHTADVRIPYSASSYSIEYLNSSNMRAKDGKVHRNYHRWVKNLDQKIKQNLANQSAQ